MTRVLVTGCSGFVGRVACEVLARAGYVVRGAVRDDARVTAQLAEITPVPDIRRDTDWNRALTGVESVVHLAARAHLANDPPGNAGLYDEINWLGTKRLGEAAAAAGVRRFVYLSSVKVNGESTGQHPFTASDAPHPLDAYGSSKWRGEQALLEIARATSMEVSIVRSPLVYGPGVRANFLRLLRWVERGRPLPFGAVRNSRSLVSIWNLTDLLGRLLESPSPGGNVWMVSDGEDLSTADLVRRLGVALGRGVRLMPVPVSLLRIGGKLLGREGEVARLCGSLRVDIERTIRELHWSPPLSVDESIARTVAWYRSEGRQRGH